MNNYTMNKTYNDLPVFRLVMGENEETSGLLATSLVAEPAHEEQFLAFAKMEEIKFSSDEMKHNVTGPLLIPDKLIYRNNERIGEHYVYFSSADIWEIARRYAKTMRTANVTVEHEPIKVDGAYVVELWITAEDKGAGKGFDVPNGTLMATMHIENEDVWNQIISGERKGFSIEGLFAYDRATMSAEKVEEKQEKKDDGMDILMILIDKTITDEEKEKRIKEKHQIVKSEGEGI